MFKNRKGLHVIEALTVILVLGIAGFAGFMLFHNKQGAPNTDRRGMNYQALAACGQQPLSTLPTDLSKLEGIAPLGNVDPPDHTLPTDHMYMMYPYGDTTQKELYAPADVVVTSISYGDVFENGVRKHGDYAVSFYPCSELKLIYGHVDTLSDKITAVIGKPENAGANQCQSSKQGNEEIRNCNWDVDIKVTANELVGTSEGWDLWATYEGHKADNVMSPEYYHNTDAVCPLDYFTPELQAQLYAKAMRTAAPRCGEAYVDKAGTLQGGWFAHKDPKQAKTDWSSHFSLTRNSVESGVGQVAVAGTIADQFMYRFTPKHSGTVNRDPSETTAGTLYCYQHEGNPRFPNGRMAGPGKILLKLTDNHTMQIEHRGGSCSGNESFSRPTTYYR